MKRIWRIIKQEAKDEHTFIRMQTKKMKTHARNRFENRLCRIKKQEANDSQTCICVQMKKMKTHAGRDFKEWIMENQKTRSE